MLAFVLISSRDGRPVDPSIVARIDRVDLPELVFVPDQHLTWSNAAKTLHCAAWQAFTELGRTGSHWHLDHETLTAFAGLPLRHDGGWDRREFWAGQLARDWESIASEAPDRSLTGPFALLRLTRHGSGSLAISPDAGLGLYSAETEDVLVISNRASLAARAVMTADQEPQRDVIGVAGLVVTGLPTGMRTGFAGVSAAPPGCGFTFDPDGRGSQTPGMRSAPETSDPAQALDAFESRLRRDLRSIAATGFERIQLLVDDGAGSSLAQAIIESEEITNRFCVARPGTIAYLGDPLEFAFRVSGGLPHADIRRLVLPSNTLHVSALEPTLDGPFWQAELRGAAGSLEEEIDHRIGLSILDAAHRADISRLLKAAILDEVTPDATAGDALVRFHARQYARAVSALNEIAPVPVVQLFSNQNPPDLASRLLERLNRDSHAPASTPNRRTEDGADTPVQLEALLKRYLDQPGNQVAELIEPAIIASVRNGKAAGALRIPEMAALLTAAIWIAGDERPVRASRPETLDEIPAFPDSASSNRLEEGAGRVTPEPGANPDPLEWAGHLQSRTRLSSLSLDARVCALVPHFDAGRFLADAIDSLTRQTRPLQAIVVIDDHSPEAPVDIVGQFPGVTLLQSPENSGPFRLVQEVIANTDFDAYLFQDADDWSEPERLEVLLSEAIRTGAEVVGSQGMRLIEREREVVSYEHPNDPGAALEQHPIGNPIHYPSSLISRDLLMRLGGFATGFRFGADTEFIRRAGYVAGLRNVPHRLYNYRTRDDSLTNAPLTGIRSEARRLNWDAQHRRARSNAERSVNGLPPMLLPMSVAAPVCLHHLAGPPLPGITREPWPASSATPGESASPRSIRPARGNRHELEVPPRPIFVIGAPRSGASLMTTALSQHNNIAAVYDAAWMAELSSSLHAIYRSPQKRSPQSGIADIGIDVEEFAAQFGAAVNALVLRGPAEGLTVDDPFDDPGPRAPGSGMFAHRWVAGADKLYESAFPLHRLFPHARFIHMLRDPDAVVESLSTDNSRLYRSKFVRLEPDHAYDLWINAVQRCREVEQALGASCIARVDRDALIDDPETVMQTVLDFLREPFEPAVLRPFR